MKFKVGDRVEIAGPSNIGFEEELQGKVGEITINDGHESAPYWVKLEEGEYRYFPENSLRIEPSPENPTKETRNYNVGESNYSQFKIQPWDIWLEYDLNPWDADIIKRVLREKKGQSRKLDYEKIIHVCKERIRQLDE